MVQEVVVSAGHHTAVWILVEQIAVLSALQMEWVEAKKRSRTESKKGFY